MRSGRSEVVARSPLATSTGVTNLRRRILLTGHKTGFDRNSALCTPRLDGLENWTAAPSRSTSSIRDGNHDTRLRILNLDGHGWLGGHVSGQNDQQLTEQDRQFLRRAIELAWQARREGQRPFGSVLVDGQGNVVAERYNTEARDQDISAHPELKLAVEAARLLSPEERRQATMYTSTENCAMCSGAFAIAGIGKLVFSVSAAQLAEIRGEQRTTAVDAPTQLLLTRANYPITIIGPVLSDEGLAVHRDYWHCQSTRA